MATDLRAVRNNLRSVIATIIGSRLTQVPGPSNTTKPAIFTEFKKFPEAAYPYCSIGQPTRRRQGLNNLIEYLNESDLTVSAANYDYFFPLRIYGGDAVELAGDLESGFRSDSIRLALQENNIFIVDTQDIGPSEQKIGEDYIEIGGFNIVLTVPDLYVTDEGYFDNIVISGSLYEDEDDPDPMEFNFQVQ